MAAIAARVRRDLLVDAQQQRVELRVVQQGMAHWNGLFSSVGPRVAECTVPKIGRNDACPCGSGKKYKHCCFEQDRAAELAPAIAQRQALEHQQEASRSARAGSWMNDYQAALQESLALEAASNAVIELIRAGRLDEAEQAARQLLVDYPEVHDGHDRLGMVHEARGELREAADSYRRVVQFMRERPEDYDVEFLDSYLERIATLDPCAAEAPRPSSGEARADRD